MSELVCLTNNERMANADLRVEFVDGSPAEVLARAAEMLQRHYALVSAPLPPNVPMMRAPFRSLILVRTARKYDAAGILAIARARQITARQRAIACVGGSGADADFALIDETYTLRALREWREMQKMEAPLPAFS